MACMQEIRLGDVGTAIRGTIRDEDDAIVNISSATTKLFYLRKPSGTIVSKTAVFTTDGTDGKMQYVLQSGDIDTVGRWEVEAYVVLSTGEWYSDNAEFLVKNSLSTS